MVGSEGLDGCHVLHSLLYTTASLPMMLSPEAHTLSYHVLTKYLFLPNSRALSLEIPFLCTPYPPWLKKGEMTSTGTFTYNPLRTKIFTKFILIIAKICHSLCPTICVCIKRLSRSR